MRVSIDNEVSERWPTAAKQAQSDDARAGLETHRSGLQSQRKAYLSNVTHHPGCPAEAEVARSNRAGRIFGRGHRGVCVHREPASRRWSPGRSILGAAFLLALAGGLVMLKHCFH
jgi:hypothetical protein